jgi:hypothetical protein
MARTKEQPKQDIVLAAAGGYDWPKVELWARSLVTSGYTGLVLVILYDGGAHNAEVKAKLEALGIQVVIFPLRGTVFNQRFYDFHEVLEPNLKNLRYAVVTDIRDVIFQSDPMEVLDCYLSGDRDDMHLYAASESLLYKDEAWGKQNIVDGYPLLAAKFMDKTIYNVGVLCGKAKAVADMCLSIGIIAKSSGFPVADQSGYNILLDTVGWSMVTLFGEGSDGFVCQAGTTADPRKIDGFRPNLLDPEPVFKDGVVQTHDGMVYPIVHQYDRVPEWIEPIRAKIDAR